ncbi:MAG: prepilin peptidase [Parvularcula sp.]
MINGYFIGLLGLLGLAGGSFLTVLVTRGPIRWGLVDRPDGLPDGYGLAVPRSHCPHCKTQIQLPWLIPIVGYLLLRGRCRHCRVQIPRLYPALEVAGLSLGLIGAVVMPTWYGGVAYLGFGLSTLAASVIDARTGYIPDAITFPLISLGLGLSLVPVFSPWPAAAIGAAVGYGSFWALGFVFKKVRGIDGLGLGDAKLLAAIGAFVGVFALPFVVLGASATALIVMGARALLGGSALRADAEIRFGPYLATAGLVVLTIGATAFPRLLSLG